MGARPTPAVIRAAAIMDLLAEHSDRAFTMAEIVRTLRLNHATCHAVLAALVNIGYLYRTGNKAYMIAPAFERIARAGAESINPMQVALPEMRALADMFDAICTACFRENNDIVVRECATSASHLGRAIAIGSRMPLRAPFGTVFLAWDDAAAVRQWLDRNDAANVDIAHTLAQLEFSREHGFVCGFRKDLMVDHGELEPREYPARTQHIAALDPLQHYAVAFLAAPVFDENGRVAFALNFTGLSHRVTGAKLEAMGQRLRRSCNQISLAIGGVLPDAARALPSSA